MADYLCPVCRSPRSTELRDHIPALRHLQITLVVMAVTAAGYWWGGWQTAWRCVFFYLPLWAFSEFLHWAWMREAAKCGVCDFDPILYRRNPLAARRQVEAKLNTAVQSLQARLQARRPATRAPAAKQESTTP